MRKPRLKPKPRSYGRGRIYPRGGVLWVEIPDGSGNKIRKSSKSSDIAVAEEVRLGLLRQRSREELPVVGDWTVAEVLHEYLRHQTLAPGTRETFTYQANKYLIPALGHVPARKLSTDMLSDYRDSRAKDVSTAGNNAKPGTKRSKPKKISQTSINRELALLSAAFNNLAKRRPSILSKQSIPHFPMTAEDNTRHGFISEDAFIDKLYPKLPQHYRALTTCAFYCGSRAGEWLQLDWEMVDFTHLTIYFPKTKNKDPREVPIIPGLMLDTLREQKRIHDAMWPEEATVFSYQGRRMARISRAWKKACARAGYPNLIFHDMRRSANKFMRDSGVPQGIRMDIMGHKTASMDLRYGIRDSTNTDIAREKMGGRSQSLRKVKG